MDKFKLSTPIIGEEVRLPNLGFRFHQERLKFLDQPQKANRPHVRGAERSQPLLEKALPQTKKNSCEKKTGIVFYPDPEWQISTIKTVKVERWQLLQNLDNAQEAERCRLARELHDQMGQDLTALALGLQRLRKTTHSLTPEGVAQVELLQEITSQLSQQVHTLALELRPTILDDIGLLAALQQLSEQWTARTKIKIIFQVCELESQRLPPQIETTCYRIAQEALTNIAKYAQAHNVFLDFALSAQQVLLIIKDDGRGFDVAEIDFYAGRDQRLGLVGMRDRAVLAGGRLGIESAPDQGTSIILQVPIFD